jgi:hypothetical protein
VSTTPRVLLASRVTSRWPSGAQARSAGTADRPLTPGSDTVIGLPTVPSGFTVNRRNEVGLAAQRYLPSGE